jgi:hypothetical protein
MDPMHLTRSGVVMALAVVALLGLDLAADRGLFATARELSYVAGAVLVLVVIYRFFARRRGRLQ